jgi:hypothetical protein
LIRHVLVSKTSFHFHIVGSRLVGLCSSHAASENSFCARGDLEN